MNLWFVNAEKKEIKDVILIRYFNDIHLWFLIELVLVVIGKKGYLNEYDKKREWNKKFKKLRHWRSGIESLISSLIRGNG